MNGTPFNNRYVKEKNRLSRNYSKIDENNSFGKQGYSRNVAKETHIKAPG